MEDIYEEMMESFYYLQYSEDNVSEPLSSHLYCSFIIESFSLFLV